MPQDTDKNYRPQTARDKELKTYTSKEMRAMADGKNIRPKVIPGTQDTGSVLGALARGHIEAGTTAKVGIAGRDTVKDNYNISRLSDSQTATKYTAEQTAKMKSAMAKRKSSAPKSPASKGRRTMSSLLGIGTAISTQGKR
jgi:hypothetical protein